MIVYSVEMEILVRIVRFLQLTDGLEVGIESRIPIVAELAPKKSG